MPSFDIVCKPNLVELRNAVEQATREISTRFDFKGSDARVELSGQDSALEMWTYADDDFKLAQVKDVLLNKLAKRSVDVRYLDFSAKPEKMGGDKLKQRVAIRQGIETTAAKKIVGQLKESKLKVTAAIQGDAVRVTGAKKDILQDAIALVRGKADELPLAFENFRD